MNMAALRCYQLAGLAKTRELQSDFINAGIGAFASLDDALADADESIARYTRSNFPAAHFYEFIRDRILERSKPAP